MTLRDPSDGPLYEVRLRWINGRISIFTESEGDLGEPLAKALAMRGTGTLGGHQGDHIVIDFVGPVDVP